MLLVAVIVERPRRIQMLFDEGLQTLCVVFFQVGEVNVSQTMHVAALGAVFVVFLVPPSVATQRAHEPARVEVQDDRDVAHLHFRDRLQRSCQFP